MASRDYGYVGGAQVVVTTPPGRSVLPTIDPRRLPNFPHPWRFRHSDLCFRAPARNLEIFAKPLTAHLSKFAALSPTDVIALDQLHRNAKVHPAEHILIHEQSRPACAFFLGSGLAYRYRMLDGGRRQILGFIFPGDLFDLDAVLVGRADHNIALLTDAQVYSIAPRDLKNLASDFPKIGQALWLASIVDTSILREWLVNLGQRTALQRMSHFLVEMSLRLEAVGRIGGDGSFDFPFSQMILADTTGMTTVHTNRTLQKMRADGLIQLCAKRLMITDRERLAALAGFDGHYLGFAQPRN
ncbi:MAG: Crp/Fnr family transcriptional regulator [Sphingomicrobium sp.]